MYIFDELVKKNEQIGSQNTCFFSHFDTFYPKKSFIFPKTHSFPPNSAKIHKKNQIELTWKKLFSKRGMIYFRKIYTPEACKLKYIRLN